MNDSPARLKNMSRLNSGASHYSNSIGSQRVRDLSANYLDTTLQSYEEDAVSNDNSFLNSTFDQQ
jgi:hypothetical protein